MSLSEPVDLLTLAVPTGWTVLPTSPTVLPAILHQLEAQNTQLAALLKSEAAAATEGAVRLFAYTNSPSLTYVAVISYASPGSLAITADSATPFSKFNRRTANTISDTSTFQTPAGLGLRGRTVDVEPGAHLAFENLVLLSSGRTIMVHIAADVGVLSFPPVFSQVDTTIRIE